MNEAGVREIKNVCGVLTDYDISSWTGPLISDYTKTSQQRTGTPPFMARGLLDGSDTFNMYRHDVESLFYIILILATRYEIEAPEQGKGGGVRVRVREGLKKLPYQHWFDQPSFEALACFKEASFLDFRQFNLSPTFKDFRDWLWDLRLSFRRGIRSKQIHEEDLMFPQRRQQDGVSEGRVIPMFNDETLAGHIHYPALVDPVRNLEGGLKGLVIRYDPPSLPPPPPTLTSASHASA